MSAIDRNAAAMAAGGKSLDDRDPKRTSDPPPTDSGVPPADASGPRVGVPAADADAAGSGADTPEPSVDMPEPDVDMPGLDGDVVGPGVDARDRTVVSVGSGVGDAAAAVLADVRLDRATAARLRAEGRRTRERIDRRLVDAGYLSVTPGSPDGCSGSGGDAPVAAVRDDEVDERRNLSARLDENVAFFEHIDALHDRRLSSPSPRERKVATRALAEALHRIVSGYQVDNDPPHRLVLAARRMDERLGVLCDRLAAQGPRRRAATGWWARDGLWLPLCLALAVALLLSEQHLLLAAVTVTVRSALAIAFHAPRSPVGPRRRLIGYDPQWASWVATYLGDAMIMIGLGVGLHLGGHTEWGVATAFSGLVGPIASMGRMATWNHGFRLPRLWLEKVVMTALLPAALWVAALAPPNRGTAIAGAAVAVPVVMCVTAIAAIDIGRTFYYVVLRRRLFRRAAAAEGWLMPDAIVAHTNDAIVVNLSRAGSRPGVFDQGAGRTDLHVAGGDSPLGPSLVPRGRTRTRRRWSQVVKPARRSS